MNAIHGRSAAFAIAGILCGCAATLYDEYSEPYALFETEHHMTMHGIVPAVVLTIDGANVPYGRKDPVKPGFHTVAVSVAGGADPIVRELRFDAKPCMRYYVGAKRSPPPGAEWQVLVTNSEPIGECRKLASK